MHSVAWVSNTPTRHSQSPLDNTAHSCISSCSKFWNASVSEKDRVLLNEVLKGSQAVRGNLLLNLLLRLGPIVSRVPEPL